MKPGRRNWNRPQRLRATYKNRHTASAAVPLALGLVVAGMAIGYAHRRWTQAQRADPIASAAGAAILPFQRGTAATQAGLTGGIEALFRGGAIQKENQKLAARNSVLEAQVARLSAGAAEAKRLRAAVGYIAAQERPPAVCQVVAWLPSPTRHTITVAIRPGAGVVKDAAVVNSVGLIGHVVETETLRAQVLLLIDPESRIHVHVLRGTKVVGAGVVAGDGRDRFLKLDLLKPEAPIKKGDRVVTSGEGGKFPQGIAIGWIEQARRDSANLWSSVQVKPANQQPDALHEVLVLK